ASLSGGATFPTGTVFNWTINAGGTTITKTGQSVTVAPSSGAALSTIYASPTSWTISCAISHPDMANATAPSVSKPINLYQVNPPAMTVTKPGTATETATGIYKIVNMTDMFTFEATESDGSPLPTATTSFQWYVGGSLVAGETSYIFNASPTALGLSEGTMGTNQTNATSVEVKCVVTRPNGDAPAVKTIKVFKQPVLPDFTISAVPAASSYDAANNVTSGGVTTYALTSLNGTINIEATGATFPAGTTFDWTVYGTTLTTQHGSTISMSPAAMGITASSISKSSASPTSIVIKCKAKHTDATEAAGHDAPDVTLKVYLVTIPDITVTLSTPPAGLNQDPEGTYLVRIADLTTETFGFSASPTSGTMPSGVKYTWTIGTTELNSTPYTEQTISKTLLQMGVVTAPTTQQTLTVKCTVSHDNLAAGTEKYNTVNVKIIGTYSVSFAARGGTPAPATQDVASGSTATEPATAPTKTGATFGGWYTSTDNGATLSATAYDFDTPVTANVTLYAKWIYTDFTGTYDEFLAAEFVQGNDETTPYTITITSFTEQDYPSILDALTASTDTNYKGGIYVNLDLTGYTGTRIGYYGTSATKDHKEYILGISFSDSITNLYSASCSGFTNLASVRLPSSLRTIGQNSFYGCSSLTSITIPSTVTKIERLAFVNSGLTEGGLTIEGTNSWKQYDFMETESNLVAEGVSITATELAGDNYYIWKR
ncbi:MAG: InlB B-repeat-containing protein, partial [Spirochaetales bacterium]|nr:InlB B-repeat-containing protein [Spirochaetales bacterium]